MSSFVDIAAIVIHDVKNRLAHVAARAEASGDAETLRGVLESAAALSRLLAVYKADKGGLGADVDARVPADLIGELQAEIGRQTTLTVEADLAAAPALAFYDEALVRMVLLDALYNALRHARRTVRLRALADGDWLVFAVEDDGPGYPPGLLADPQGMAAVSVGGTGVGLHLAGKIAALHRNGTQEGRIELANAGGAVFRLLLPK